MDARTKELAQNPIGRLLLTYALPAIVATTATSLYHIIDRIFIGQGIGATALAGLGLTLPIMNLSTGFGTLVGSGAAALASIRIGEKNRTAATQILSLALRWNSIIGLLFAISMLLFLEPILLLFGADAETLPYAKSFLQIILAGNLFSHLLFGLNGLMRATGYPTKAMLSILLTVGCNLLLAPLFIFVFHWGIKGAAAATVCAQFIGMCWVLAHFINKKSFIHFEKTGIGFGGKLIGNIFAIGLSPFIIHICTSAITIIMNWQLGKYGGNQAIAAFGIVGSLQSLIITAILGITHGMQPIIGFNWGARLYPRVWRTYQLTAKIATLICSIGFLTFMLFPTTIAHAFTTDIATISVTKQTLRICCAMMFLIGFQVVTSTFFQALGKANLSIFLSLTRQIIFLLPFLIVLPFYFGLKGAWIALPCADFCATVVTFFVLWHFLKRHHLRSSFTYQN